MSHPTFNLDGQDIPFSEGQTLMEAATAAGVYIPHLCHNPEFTPHGSCKLCTVKVNGRNCSACTFPASAGQQVLSNTRELNDTRRALTQMLFVEGNHLCPGCEKSGDCLLQATGYHLGMLNSRFPHFFPHRAVDASHPDILLTGIAVFFANCVSVPAGTWTAKMYLALPVGAYITSWWSIHRPAC
jgi:[NiFe] hydrogenase diaphorase moiety small subunit